MERGSYQHPQELQQSFDPEGELQTYEEILEDYRRRQMLEHLTGPMISLVVHVVLVFACALLLAGKEMPVPPPGVEFTITKIPPVVIPPRPVIPEEPEPAEPIIPVLPSAPPPPIDVAQEDPSKSILQDIPGADETSLIDLEKFVKQGPLEIIDVGPPTRAPEEHDEAVTKHGADTRTEIAVMKALKWLRDHQEPDGHWSPKYPEAMTGLGLLTFLAHGETLASKEFGSTVQRAIQYLLAAAESQDVIGGRAYSHGIVTYALAEAYSMTRLPILKRPLERAVTRIVEGQQEQTGGFNYGYKSYAIEKRWDLSVSAWQFQALKAAYVARCDVDGLEDAIFRGTDFIKEWTYKDGRFGYSSPGSGSPGMQGAGTLCLQLLGAGDSREARAGVEYLVRHHRVEWEDEAQYALHHHPSYNWYYLTQAAFHGGRRYWRKWNPHYANVIIDNQQEDGHWECPGKDSDIGSPDPYYSTCLNALTLQVIWRYLPTYEEQKPIVRRENVFEDIETF